MIISRELIDQAKQKIGDRNAELIFHTLGIDDYDTRNQKALCCFHEEDTPSLVYDKKNYRVHCFGCGVTYDLVSALMLKKNMTFLEAVSVLFSEADMPVPMGEHHVRTKRDYRYPREEPVGDKHKVYEYLETRHISKKAADYLDIRQDKDGNMVFNYYDTNDVLMMVKYRPSRRIGRLPSGKRENKCWCQRDADTTQLLFNMNRIDPSMPLVICEGELDCAAVIQSGYLNVVSVPLGANNYGWIEENWDWLEQFDKIIVCSDNDEAGDKMQREIVFRLGSWRTMIVDIPHTLECDGKAVAVKDMNEVLYYGGEEMVMNMIVNAKDCPVNGVIDFSDIQDVDIDKIDGIKTGIKELDRYIMKLFYGTFNILTGVNGSGKSSLLSQIICSAVDDGKNIWMYSGELPNTQAKNWIQYVFAGQRHLKQYQYGDSVYWKVTQDAKKSIDDYYRGRIFIDKDSEDNSVDAILKRMEATIRKYGAKMLIIDNLTAVNLGGSHKEKYKRQANFVKSLIDMAKRFNVVVILVVHPHKLEQMRRMTKMDVQGISAIIDLAHRIISLYRVQPVDHEGIRRRNGSGFVKDPIPEDVLCDILKDRMMGFEGKSVGLYYDRPSRRFFTNVRDLDHQYKWDKSVYDTPLPFSPPQLKDKYEEVFGSVRKDSNA